MNGGSMMRLSGMIRKEWLQVIRDPSSIMVEHGNVSARHVRHVNLVSVFHHANERSSHADDVIIRVRTKTEHSLSFTLWILFLSP